MKTKPLNMLSKLKTLLRPAIVQHLGRYTNVPWANTVLRKVTSAYMHLPTTHTLAFGSSHGFYSFIPTTGEFNLCLDSQDLYYSFKTYETIAPHAPNLKTIIIYYSIFSPGFELERTAEASRGNHYQAFLNIPFKTAAIGNQPAFRKEVLACQAMKLLFARHQDPNYRGFETFEGTNDDTLNTDRLTKNLQHNQRNNNQTRYLAFMLALAQEYKHTVLIVTPPMRPDYRRKLPPVKELFSELNTLLDHAKHPHLKHINLFADTDFKTAHFVDFDHLNLSGAELLTSKIHQALSA